MKRNLLLALVGIIALLAASCARFPVLSSAAVAYPGKPSLVTLPTSGLAAPRLSTLGDLESAYVNIYNQVNPSVVLINVTVPATGSSRRGTPSTRMQQALGSGFMWDTQGNIVTNNHVIDGATKISVTLADETVVPAKLVGADPYSDLAVIKIDLPAGQLHPVQMADSTAVQVGQLAIAIGNPYGEQNTMTTGIVSAVGRSLPISDSPTQGPGTGQSQSQTYTIPDVIQTDAPINPGNSGGVLLNSSGQVIGVTQSIESASGSSAGIGFAIPSAIVAQVVPELIKTGHYDHPYLGISGTSLTPGISQAIGLPDTQRGVLVADVTTNGPAAKAGLIGSTKPATVDGEQILIGGDVIIAIDGQAVKSFEELVAYLARATKVNQTVTLTILRGGKEQSLPLTLTARPAGA